ncbi:atad3 [Symbiodinium sp. KB8]|nr:atad3 [Symbiodinium sp. KB8]
MSQFDADALERAAKAARELERSRNVKALVEISRRESEVKVAEAKRDASKAEAEKAAFVRDQERVRWEEQRKTIKYQQDQQRAQKEYEHELAKKRLEEEHQKSRQRMEERIQRETEEMARRDAIRTQEEERRQRELRKTEEHRAMLERENMRARAIAEAEGRIKEQRENEDLFTRRLRVQGEERRREVVEGITTFFDSLGSSLSAFVSDRSKVYTTIAGLTGLAAGVFAMRETARVTGRFIERRLGTPSLVRETSRSLGHFGLQRRLMRMTGMVGEEEGFKSVVLEPETMDRIHSLSKSVSNTRQNAAPFRHMLFYGPPGTGKTMVAKRLAKSSGLDFARNALNALLYRTGEASHDFMMVLATNRPGDLDSAVTDRVDESLVFGLPSEMERQNLIRVYFEKYIVRSGEGDTRSFVRKFLRPPSKIIVSFTCPPSLTCGCSPKFLPD